MAIDVKEYYTTYGPMVLRRCRKMLRDEHAAMDAMQDTFVQILKHQEKLECEAPSSYLYRVATNICLNKIRSSKRRPEDSNEKLLLQIASWDDPSERVSALQLLDRLFKREKASTRTIAVLHYLDGLTLQEVADQVGLSVSGIRKRLRNLKEHLTQLEGGNEA